MDRGAERGVGKGDDPRSPELEEILALTAHELHEPLRKITAFGDLLRDRAGPLLDEESSDYLARMERAADRMRETLACVLAFARVPRGLPFVTIDLAEAVSAAVEKKKEALAQVAGVVQAGPLPPFEGDPFQMQTFFEQLLDNSIKFRKDGVPPRVRVEEAPPPAPGLSAVAISDNGQGFDDAFAERIFRPFERLHPRGKYAGSGMGLAICKKIAERHGATLRAHGVPGEGATITLVFPASKGKPRAGGGPT
jgi:light-regulated signal transduction histidine kinase (bacteriophytochrome)